MFGRAALLGIVLLSGACTDSVLFQDMVDGGKLSPPAGKDAAWPTTSDAACEIRWKTLTLKARAAQVIVLFDRSVSMEASIYGTTRADAAESALLSVINEYQAKVKFGFEQFPADSSDKAYADCQRGLCCAGPVDVKPTYNAYSAIKRPLQCSDPVGNPCPIASYDSPSNASLEQVRDYYKSNYSSTSDDRYDDRYVLLVTASEPTCLTSDGDDACGSAIDSASSLGNLGVRVVVLSVGYQPGPGSCLVRISDSGSSLSPPPGTSTLYTPSSVNELNSKMRDFVSAVARTGCTLVLDNVPPAQSQLWVYLGETKVNWDPSNGWSFTNSARTTVTLSGDACDLYLRSQSSAVSVGYTCCANACQ